MKKTLSILLYIIAIVLPLAAQIQVSAPHNVAVGEQFRLQYTVPTTDVKGFRAGNIPDGFDVLMGPSTSTQQSFQMINGHTSSSSSVTYTYILCAMKNGTFVIPGAKAKVDGKDATSQSIKITVSGKAQNNNYGSQGGSQRQPAARENAAGSRISGNDLFIKVSANKQQVYEQEPILLTYKVYTQVELTQLEGKMPDLKGFHSQEMPLPQQKSFHIENVNGRPYRCVTWSQYVMYPQVSGKLEIPSITFKGIVVQENPNVDPFEAFFNGGSGYVEVKKDIKAAGVHINVLPLPSKPTNFSGGVGSFTLSASADKTSVKAGDPVNIKVVVSGTGNLKLIKQPELSLPKDFDKYEPKITDKTNLSANGLSGSMVYDFLIVPRNKGTYTVPSIDFVYFDTNSKSYKTIKTNPIELTVSQGNGSAGSVTNFTEKEDSDIHPIYTGSVKSEESSYFGSSLYYAVNALLFALLVAIVAFFRKKALEIANMTQTKSKKANKVATKRLRKAADFMKKKQSSAFYDEVLRTLWGYVSDKLVMPVSQLSRQNIQQCLIDRNIDSNDINSFIEALDECEFQRYAPGDPEGNMQKTFDKAVSAIVNIEEGMKNSNKTQDKTDSKTSYLSVIAISVFLFGAILSPSSASAESTMPVSDATIAQEKTSADSAYIKGDYQKSITIYNSILKSAPSADVYYNLGNAYYSTDNITQAIIAYERARLLSPSNEDINHNLKIAVAKTIDNLPVEEANFFLSCYNNIRDFYSIDKWAQISTIAFLLCIVLFCAYLFFENVVIRKITFYASVFMLILFISGNFFAWRQKSYADNYTGAVVINPAITIKKTPTAQSENVGVLHEGSHINITDDSMREWLQISTSDGKKGWISNNGIEKILK